jgi:ABC-2 type transport system permease protein
VTSRAVPAALGRQIGYEQRSYWRNPLAAGFTFAFPLLFLVIFIAINSNDTIHYPGGTVKFAQYYVPAIIAFGIISACYTNLAITTTHRREEGLMKRARSTPLRPSIYLGGMLGNSALVAIILAVLVLALGLSVYGVTWQGHLVAFVVTIIVGAFCFTSCGVLMSTLVPNEDAAPAIVNFVIFPLLFISGTFGRVNPRSTLGHISALFPVRHLNEAMTAVFDPFVKGNALSPRHLLVLLAWGVGAMLLAIVRFRWEPVNG